MPHPQKQQSSKATAKLGEKHMHTHTHTHTHAHTLTAAKQRCQQQHGQQQRQQHQENAHRKIYGQSPGAETTVRRFACTCGTLHPEKPQDHSRPSKTHLSPKKKTSPPRLKTEPNTQNHTHAFALGSQLLPVPTKASNPRSRPVIPGCGLFGSYLIHPDRSSLAAECVAPTLGTHAQMNSTTETGTLLHCSHTRNRLCGQDAMLAATLLDLNYLQSSQLRRCAR